jgi:hypothetical protein
MTERLLIAALESYFKQSRIVTVLPGWKLITSAELVCQNQ